MNSLNFFLIIYLKPHSDLLSKNVLLTLSGEAQLCALLIFVECKLETTELQNIYYLLSIHPSHSLFQNQKQCFENHCYVLPFCSL